MERAFITLVFSICSVRNSLGLPSLTCDDVDPILPSTVKCSCQNVGAPGISWYREGVFLTSCIQLSGQCFTSMGYTFSVDSTTSSYTIEFGSYNYTECTNLKCSDSTTPSDSDLKRISVNVTKYSPTLSLVNEPSSSHMNGNIDFTTDCIYKANSSDINVTAIWTAVVNGTEEDDLDIKGTISKTGSCQFCTDDFASEISVSYIHQEEQSESRIKANIRLKLLIDELPYERTTKNEYYVKVRSGPTSKSWCCFDEIWCIIIIVIVVVLAISYIPAAVVYCNKQCFKKLIIDLKKKKRILFIPFCGCYLIIRHYKCCNLDKIQPGTQYERSLTNKSFTSDWTQASNGESDKEQDALDGILTICWTKHQRIDEDGICCENCKVQGDSEASHAYCLSDEVYICTKCLNESHKTCVLLWIPDNIAGKDHKLCCDEHYNLEDLKLKGVCQKCERFICSKCMADHSGHVCTRHQQLHETCSDGVVNTFHAQGLSSQTKLCSGCRKHPIECLKVHTGIELCADCFEKGQEQEEGRMIENINLRDRQEPCQVHGVLGKGRPLPVEAYCFVCRLYMCVGCFKKHRRIYEYWSKYLEGNSFYCRCCEVNEIYPVVCFDLSSSWFKCAKCFLSKRESRKTNSHPKEDIILSNIDQTITETKHLQCSKARSKGKRLSCKPEVYCLVCKLVMCTTCFRRHQQENKSTFTDAMIRNK